LDRALFLIPLLPFLGFVVLGVAGKRLPRSAVGPLACAGPAASALLAFAAFREMAAGNALASVLGDWIRTGDLHVPLGFRVDRLSGTMLLIVTGVGTLIHVYSIGYMREDPGYPRFFAYLNLFMAAMLVLVLADNLVFLFLGWEGVGLCSYLLIGFWYQDIANTAAGTKAFVVNRIGDLGFIIGIFLVFVTFGTFRFDQIDPAVGTAAPGAVTAIALLLFVGATGKSAQIPLYVWLPDAMAGPTPVSALIHAATMVTSGVYLLARMSALYAAAPAVLAAVAAIGAFTAVLAALIAITQTDIKKVLAYSTVSQLGYMFLAAGLGAFGTAVFHLVTHAFFKALLFLGAGAVIHALHHEQDMRRMGGLWKRIPRTGAVFIVGALALAGFPLTSGFFSKDAILHGALDRALGHGFHAGWFLLWLLGFATAAITAYYIFRQVALVFFGKYRGDGHAHGGDAAHGHGHATAAHEIHEPPAVMMVPLYALAVLSLVGGFLDVPGFLAPAGETHHAAVPESVGWVLGAAAALGGIAFALHVHVRKPGVLRRIAEGTAWGRRFAEASRNAFHVDALYERLVVRPFLLVCMGLYIVIDRALIDWVLVGGTGLAMKLWGGALRRLQTGRIPTYAAWFACGVLVVLATVFLAS
jgi:NADH-quinone oxidoreductase subunit L